MEANTRKRLKNHVRAYHSHLSPEAVDGFSTEDLLAMSHPSDREIFLERIKKEEKEIKNQ